MPNESGFLADYGALPEGSSEDMYQLYESMHPGVRFRPKGHDRQGILANINKALEKFIHGRTYDRAELPQAMFRNNLPNIMHAVNAVRVGGRVLPPFRADIPVGRQANINPATNQNEFMSPFTGTSADVHLLRPSDRPPSTAILQSMTRDAPNTMSQRYNPNREANFRHRAEYLDAIPTHQQNLLMGIDRMRELTARNRGVLTPANRTPTQEYNAASTIQNNPAYARHIGILKALKGE